MHRGRGGPWVEVHDGTLVNVGDEERPCASGSGIRARQASSRPLRGVSPPAGVTRISTPSEGTRPKEREGGLVAREDALAFGQVTRIRPSPARSQRALIEGSRESDPRSDDSNRDSNGLRRHARKGHC